MLNDHTQEVQAHWGPVIHTILQYECVKLFQ